MKKKIAGLLSVTAAFTVMSGITAFAGTWVPDTKGWMYQWDDGNIQGMGWFTDPDTNLEYYIDPDGYMMAGTHVEGYWLDDSGVKHEKSEAQMEAEQRRAERLASRPSPGKDAKAATDAGTAAVSTGIASSTLRMVYSNEMLNLYDSIFLEAKKGILKSEYKDYTGSISRDNIQTTYYYDVQDMGRVLEGTIWKSSKVGSLNYTPYAVEIKYNRNVVPSREDSQYFETAFKSLMTAALGQTEGQKVYERVSADAPDSDTSYTLSGVTDTGNSYELTYRYSTADIKVICSEIAPEEESTDIVTGENEEADTQSEFTENEPVTTSVITAGASQQGQTEEAEQTEETEQSAGEEQSEESEQPEDVAQSNQLKTENAVGYVW